MGMQIFNRTTKYARNLTSLAKYQSRKRRALMYMPGDDLKKITKASSLDLDLAVLDLEDAVAITSKSTARNVICEALNNLEFGRTETGVRVNSVSSGLLEDDLCCILTNKTQPDIYMIPKVDTPEECVLINDVISQTSYKPIPIIFQTESAIGLINLHKIIKTLYASTHIIPVAIVFGADDYVSDINGFRDDINAVMYARQKIVTYARAYNLQPIDRVHIEFKNLQSLQLESSQGFSFGFAGKQCIHLLQIPVIQAAFTPSLTQLEHARELIKCFNENQDAGIGAFTFRGKMIDRPTLLQAKNTVDMFKDCS